MVRLSCGFIIVIILLRLFFLLSFLLRSLACPWCVRCAREPWTIRTFFGSFIMTIQLIAFIHPTVGPGNMERGAFIFHSYWRVALSQPLIQIKAGGSNEWQFRRIYFKMSRHILNYRRCIRPHLRSRSAFVKPTRDGERRKKSSGKWHQRSGFKHVFTLHKMASATHTRCVSASSCTLLRPFIYIWCWSDMHNVQFSVFKRVYACLCVQNVILTNFFPFNYFCHSRGNKVCRMRTLLRVVHK